MAEVITCPDDIVNTVNSLPTLPDTAIRLIELAKNENYSVAEVEGVVKSDPALAARVLKVANSPFYGFLGRISSIEHATSLLGINELKNIFVASAMANYFAEGSQRGYLLMKRLRDHSVKTGLVARMIGEKFNESDVSEFFLTGLIHDIGMVVFAKHAKEHYFDIVADESMETEEIIRLEKETFGANHSEAGALALENWRLPFSIVYPVLYHHEPWVDTNYPLFSMITHLADFLSHLTGEDPKSERQQMRIERFLGTRGAMMISDSGFDLTFDSIVDLRGKIDRFLLEAGDVANLFA